MNTSPIYSHLDRDTLNACVAPTKHTPKCLGYKSPPQAFFAQLLHFNVNHLPACSRE